MSVYAMTSVLRYSRTQNTARLVMIAIAQYANDHGEAWPGVESLAHDANCSVRSVQNGIDWAVKVRELKVEKGKGPRGTNRYTILLPDIDTPAKSARGADSAPPTPKSPAVAQVTPGADVAPPQDLHPRRSREGSAPEPSGTVSTPSVANAPSGDIDHSKPSKRQIDAMFDRFWATYPKRKGKRGARLEFERALKRGTFTEILCGAERYRDDPKRDPEFTAHPSTWLHQDRWTDELDGDAAGSELSTDEIRRRLGVTA